MADLSVEFLLRCFYHTPRRLSIKNLTMRERPHAHLDTVIGMGRSRWIGLFVVPF
jgi:hypothetical protein